MAKTAQNMSKLTIEGLPFLASEIMSPTSAITRSAQRNYVPGQNIAITISAYLRIPGDRAWPAVLVCRETSLRMLLRSAQ